MKLRGALAKISLLLIAILMGSLAVTSKVTPEASPVEGITPPQEMVVIAVGDIACSPDNPYYNNGQGTADRCRHEAVVNAINKEPHIDAAILLGDLQYEQGEYDSYLKSFAPAWSRIEADHILAVSGNHDYGSKESADSFLHALPETFGLRFVSFKDKTYGDWTMKNWTFIGLDSDCQFIGGCHADDPQGVWLKNTLKTLPTRCSLAFWHYPIFSSGPHPVNNMKPLWSMLEQAGNDLVLSGHEHFYERFGRQGLTVDNKDGMREFIAGTGGHSLFDFLLPYQPGHEASAKEYGYLKLILRADNYTWEFITVDGQVRDGGSEACHGPVSPVNAGGTDSTTNHEPLYTPGLESEEDAL